MTVGNIDAGVSGGYDAGYSGGVNAGVSGGYNAGYSVNTRAPSANGGYGGSFTIGGGGGGGGGAKLQVRGGYDDSVNASVDTGFNVSAN